MLTAYHHLFPFLKDEHLLAWSIAFIIFIIHEYTDIRYKSLPLELYVDIMRSCVIRLPVRSCIQLTKLLDTKPLKQIQTSGGILESLSKYKWIS